MRARRRSSPHRSFARQPRRGPRAKHPGGRRQRRRGQRLRAAASAARPRGRRSARRRHGARHRSAPASDGGVPRSQHAAHERARGRSRVARGSGVRANADHRRERVRTAERRRSSSCGGLRPLHRQAVRHGLREEPARLARFAHPRQLSALAGLRLRATTRRRKVMRALFVLVLALWTTVASAQAFPSKPIRMIVPFPAGGTTDIVARLVGQRMQETMGQPILVENKGGAGGQIGAAEVAKAAPDGYTLLMHNITFPMASVAAQVQNRPMYNIDGDFAGVSIAVLVPLVITASTQVPASDLRSLVDLLKGDRSLKYTYGSTGPGSFMHVMGEALSKQTGIEMTHIPFKGAAPLKQELIAGRLNVGGDQLSSSLADIKAGKIKALATNASTRVPDLPDVPTTRELGFDYLEADGWNGVFAPAKTPRPVIDRLQKEIAAAVNHPET